MCSFPSHGMAALLLLLLPCSIAAYDGQAFKASEEEADRLWNDPNCTRTQGSTDSIDWDAVRVALHRVPFPDSVPKILEIAKRLERIAVLEHEVSLCPFGVTTALFFLVKFFLEIQRKPAPARTYFSLLDSFASGFHPSLLDGADWLVKDKRITSLRRAVLKTLRPSEASVRWPAVFVYDGEVPEVAEVSQGATFCGKGQWAMEVHIHEWLLASPHLTRNPEEADFFFVPGYGICMFEAGFVKYPELDEVYKRLVRKLPHFSRHHGRDHIFTFGSGMGLNVFRSWKDYIPEAIFLTPETSIFNDIPYVTEPPFDSWKDVAIPGYLHRHEALSLTSQARSLKDRGDIAVFFGRVDSSRGLHPNKGGIDARAAIKGLEDRIFIGQNLSLHEMHGRMGNARFCLVPKGKSAWSLRLYEALFAGCVPVVLSDDWELPFEDFLDLPSFIIKWPVGQIGPAMMDRLEAMPDAVVQRYMDAGQASRCWYLYPPRIHEVHAIEDPEADVTLLNICPHLQEENAFSGIMKMLSRKQRASRTTGAFFGLPSLVNKTS